MRTRLSILLLLALCACRERTSLKNVPAHQGTGTCKIRLREPREMVLLRCGGPCAEATFPDGKCPPGRGSVCENRCDVYQDVEVCYAFERVVSLARIDREFGRFKWCFWPEPEPIEVNTGEFPAPEE